MSPPATGPPRRAILQPVDGERDDGTAPDAVLIARYAGGDPAAARALARRHLPRVLAVARRMARDPAEAEDIAQEAMLRLWQGAATWRGEARLSTWLYRVTANLALDGRRRRRAPTLPAEALAAVPDPAPGAEASLAAADRAAALEAALRRLPERQRLAIVLRHIEELSQEEVAAIMGVSVPAAESLIARGRRSLEAALRPRDDLRAGDR